MRLRVGIVGCGLIGTRRAVTATRCGDRVAVVADLDRSRAEKLARTVGARVASGWEVVVSGDDVDAIVVATFNSALAPVALAALEAGKHVLCEKPFGRNATEAETLLRAAEAGDAIAKVGFTLRHHEGIAEAHAIAAAGGVGDTLALRCTYGHGGRPGYDREWRADAQLSGGGELLDQGVHVVDLARWFLGDFESVTGAVATWAWDLAPLEDNAFALLRTAEGKTALAHTSWTQWKNLFRFELLGADGLITVEGLGGSYGPERVLHARRNRAGGPPAESIREVQRPETAWEHEWREFTSAIAERRQPIGSALDGYEAARIIDALYRSAETGLPERLVEGVAL